MWNPFTTFIKTWHEYLSIDWIGQHSNLHLQSSLFCLCTYRPTIYYNKTKSLFNSTIFYCNHFLWCMKILEQCGMRQGWSAGVCGTCLHVYFLPCCLQTIWSYQVTWSEMEKYITHHVALNKNTAKHRMEGVTVLSKQFYLFHMHAWFFLVLGTFDSQRYFTFYFNTFFVIISKSN